MGLVLVVAAVRIGATGEGLSQTSSVVLDLLAILGTGALYGAVARPRSMGPLQTLAVPFAVALAVLGFTAVVAAVHDGTIDPKTALPIDRETAMWGAGVALAELGLSIIVLSSLRPLVLHRRRRATSTTWAVLLLLGLTAAVIVAGRPVTSPAPMLLAVPIVGSLLLATSLSLRQGWVEELTSGRRLIAAALALALATVLVGLLYLQQAGPAMMQIGNGTGPVEAVAYTVSMSRSLASLITLALSFGGLYAFTAGLVLLFGLPSADLQDQRTGERRALRSLSDLSGGVLDRSALTAAVAQGPVEAGLADAAWVALTDPAQGSLTPRVEAAAGIVLEAAERAVDVDALYRAALEAGAPLVLPHAEADHRVRARAGDGVASLVALPLGNDDSQGTRGVLIVTRSTVEAFEPDDLSALDTFAGQAALSLSHADLFANALERERLARELSLAREVQQRLLPQSLPEIEGLEISAAERPAREVGGDYYDAVRLGDDCVGIIVADVSGKGAAAAFYMAELKGVFQAASRLTRSPGQLLEGANSALSPSLGRGVFVSAAYAVLDADAETLSLARAGHTPAILVRDRERPDGGRWLLRGDGLAIGLDRRGPLFRKTLVEQTVSLAPGDTLLLYTDGLVEARDLEGEEYGYDRLATFVETWAHTGATELRDLLLAEHREWSDSSEPDDDTTFVVMRWTGRGSDVPPADVSVGPPLTERPAFSS